MNRVTLTVYRGIDGPAIHGAIPYDLSFSWGLTGCESMTARLAMPATDAMRMVASSGLLHCVISALGTALWSGRAESVSVIEDGVEITAYGYWRSLSDLPYTAMWSKSGVDDWQPVSDTQYAGRAPQKYEIDTNERLYVALKKNEAYENLNQGGAVAYRLPDESSTSAATVAFDYAYTLPTNWILRVWALDESFSSLATNNITAVGGTASGAFSWTTGVAAKIIMVECYNATGALATYTGETGANYFRCTNVRLKGTTSSTVTPSAIATTLLTSAAQLESTGIIATNSMDLLSEVYEDAYPADILTRLAGLGDASGNRWEVGVNENRALYYRMTGSAAREWQADLLEFDFSRSVSDMNNSIYAVYKDASGRLIRGTTSTNSQSTGLFGVTRRAALDVDTTSATQANYHRDVALNDRAFPPIKTSLRIAPVGAVDLWMIRAGDYIRLRNVPPMFGNYGDVTRIRIARSEYNATNDTLTLETEIPGASLDFIVAREAAGVSRRAMDRIRRG